MVTTGDARSAFRSEESGASHELHFLDLPDEALRHRCEQTVRNYDPCISCAAHFLRLEMDRN